MSNRNFDNRVIIQRLQNQVYSRNLYLNNTTGKQIISNPQNTNGNASVFNTYKPGVQTQYFRGLTGSGETVSLGSIADIQSNKGSSLNISSPDPVVPDPVVPDPVVPNPVVPDSTILTHLKAEYLPNSGTSGSWTNSIGDINATITGSPTYSSSLGYTFNGTSQYGRIVNADGFNNFNNTDNYTVEVWCNPSAGQGNSTTAAILEKWNSTNESRYPYVFRYSEAAKRVQISVYDGTNNPTISISNINTAKWVQIVGVFDFTNNVMTAYINGSSVSTQSLLGVDNVSNTSQVAIGHRIISTTQLSQFMFKGSIGLIRIYDTVLTNSNVLTNFNANKNIFGL